MMKKLSSRIRHWATPLNTLAVIIIFIVFGYTVLPAQAARVESYDQGTGSLDTHLSYSADEFYTIAEAYGENGRQAYVRSRFSFDVLFPLVYGAFLCLTISYGFKAGLDENSPWQRANLVPVIAVIFDLLENTVASVLMLAYPSKLPILAALSSLFTSLKWVFVGAGFGLVIIGFIVWGVGGRREKSG